MSLDLTHDTYVYHWVRPKWFPRPRYIRLKPCTYLVPRLIVSPKDRNKLPLDPRHLGVPSGVSKWFLSLWYVQRKPCTNLVPRLTVSLNGRKWVFTWPTSPWSSIGCVKMISETMVCSTQTLHLSCAEINSISKWTEMSFHLTYVT
jgi:hypothetical protein